MKCTCGYETQPGAKFCVQCGTTLIPPAGVASPAAATTAPTATAAAPAPKPASASATGMRPAASGSTPASDTATGIGRAAGTVAPPSAASSTMARPAATVPPVAAPTSVPAREPPSARAGLIVGVIVGVVAAVAIGGYLGYRMLFGDGSSSRTASSGTSASSAAAPEPAKAAAPTLAPAQDSSSMQSMPVAPRDTEPKLLTKEAVANATDTTKAMTGASTKDASKSTSTKAPDAPATPGTASPTLDPSRPATVAGTPGQAPAAVQPDRWKLMREAMGRCSGESFLKRVTCEQAVGQQYCEGYWGKVPQCPNGPPRERGQ